VPPRRSRSTLSRWPLLACLLALAAVGTGRAQAPPHAQLLLNQKRIEIGQLIEMVSKETGRTILYDEQVRGTVSLVAKRPVTSGEAWEILGSALHMLGYSLLPSTVDQWRIARVADAVGESPFVAAARRESDLFVTALIPLRQAELQSVMNVLQPLAGSGVTLVANPDTNSLIASGPERAIARLTAIADELDRVEERAIRQRVLRYRGVADVQAMIEAQIAAGRFDDGDLEVWVDERTNSVIFRGADETVARLITFLELIDVPVEGGGEIRILRVLNRDAAEIAEILGGQVPGAARSKSKKSDETGKAGKTDDAKSGGSGTGRDGTGGGSDVRSQGQGGGLEESGQTGTSGTQGKLLAAPGDPMTQTQTQNPTPPQPQTPNSGRSSAAGTPVDLRALLAGEDYSIVVDGPTRSLVVRASERGHALIRELVEELDAAPQLIAVDITVAELRTPTTWGLALSYHLPLLPGDSLDEFIGRQISLPAGGGFGTAPIDQGALFGRVSRDAGIDFDVPGEGGVQVPIEDTIVIDATDRKIRNEVLMQPSLVVIAGEEHELFVGNNVPIPVSDTSTGATTVPSTTVRFDRQDIGIRISFEARAGKEGPIALDLETEITSLAPSVAGDPTKVGPTLIKQVLSGKARIEDGETAILGVDRELREQLSQGGTPWLTDIPFLGWIWKARGRAASDVRLVIAARARRISTPAELVADTIRRRLAFDRQSARESNLPETDAPYGVRVTTRALEDDAIAIARDLEGKGHRTRIHSWRSADRRLLFDVYVMGLDSMVDASDLAYQLSEDGWDADLVVFTSRS